MNQTEEALTGLISKDPAIVNENADKDSDTFSTVRDLTVDVVSKFYALNHLLPKHVTDVHQRGDIHFRDLGYHPFQPLTNCCLIDAKNMLHNGFGMNNVNATSLKSIQAAPAQLIQIIANVSNSRCGGCTADRIGELLNIYTRRNKEQHKDIAKQFVKESEIDRYADQQVAKDINDAIESLEYEVNASYTSNGQTPFVTLGFDLGTDHSSRKIQQAILNTRIKGLGKDRTTAIFLKLVFSVRKGTSFNPQDPNHDIKQLALKCSTKRIYPDILNYDKLVEVLGDFKAPMGCRSFLPSREDAEGHLENNDRCDLGAVTLNLPKMALKSAGNMTKFWGIFYERIDVLHGALLYRINRLKDTVPNNAPILYKSSAFNYKLKEANDVAELFRDRHATISMGHIGLYKTATVFYGPNQETSQKTKALTLEILREMERYQTKWTESCDIRLSIYSTSSESLTDRFCHLDQEKFGDIEDITDKEYYQNSFHYDVRKGVTPFKGLDFEKDYPYYASGGFIHCCEYPELRHSLKALEAVWDYSYDRVGYLGTNIPIDHCYECDYDGGFEATEKGLECPNCDNDNPKTVDVVKRTCDYLGNPAQHPVIKGRHKEICARVKHTKAPRE